jgi:hypothetical protein
MTALKRLLTETCQGVQDDDLLKEYIPMSRRWIEGLHLALNSGNSAHEHARNVLSVLVQHDGDARHSAGVAHAAEMWTAPKAGSIQTREFREQGFDFQRHVEEVFGPKLKIPLTKFHGSQVETLFKHQSGLWDTVPLKSALAVLKEDRSLGVYVRDLQTAWAALSDIHSIVNSHPSQPDRLDAAVRQFAGAMLSSLFRVCGCSGALHFKAQVLRACYP